MYNIYKKLYTTNRGGLPWAPFDSVFAAIYHITHNQEHPTNKPSDVSAACTKFFAQCFQPNPSKRPEASVCFFFVSNFEAQHSGGSITLRSVSCLRP